MAKMGRPKKEIDFDELIKLCALQCTQEEIAGWFGCTIETIEARTKEYFGQTFLEFFQEHRQGGKISLRRRQFQTAMDGNPALLIWLGRQYLGQKDKTYVENAEVAAEDKLIIKFPDEQL